MAEAKFKVGDRVLVTDEGYGIYDAPATIRTVNNFVSADAGPEFWVEYDEGQERDLNLFYENEVKPDPDYAEDVPETKEPGEVVTESDTYTVETLIRAVEEALAEFKYGDAVRHLVEFALRDEQKYAPF